MWVYGIIFWIMNTEWGVVKEVPITQGEVRGGCDLRVRAVFTLLDLSLIWSPTGDSVLNSPIASFLILFHQLHEYIYVKYWVLLLPAWGNEGEHAVDCSCVGFMREERLQSSKTGLTAPSPQGWGGWRQTVMLSTRREVAERIRPHTENISTEPLSSRGSIWSCEEKRG